MSKKSKPLVSVDELNTIEAAAQARGDMYTVAEVRRARQGSEGAMIACAMILGR